MSGARRRSRTTTECCSATAAADSCRPICCVEFFLAAFDSEVLAALEDQATIRLPAPLGPEEPRGKGARLAFTTDALVVRPMFFPAGTTAVSGRKNMAK